MLPVEVLKFGSSVLSGPEDLPTAVDEVYRRLREGYRVLAVVSAFSGETDRLFRQAAEVLGPDAAPEATAAYVATGELQSAALFAGALLRAGITARVVDPREIMLTALGTALEADPVSVDADVLRELWITHAVLVLPGFVAIDATGRIALLGRGGSDLSALYLARALRARCRLVKDVPGIFDRDPAVEANARRYAVIPWHEASKVAGLLIQPKALAFADRNRTPFSVGGANGALGTEVSDVPASVLGARASTLQPLRVALLGLGTVGLGVCERLLALPDQFELAAVAVRRPERHLASGISARLVTDDTSVALRVNVDLVIECMSGVEPAGSIIEAALAMGKVVVSANKAAVAEYWPELALFAQEPDRRLWYSAAVGGAIPMLETLAQLDEPVRELRGVISGTCNSVLDRLAAGESLESAVSAARASGFAEADASNDLSGRDSANKLSLLAQAAFRFYVPPGRILTRGVDGSHVPDKTHVWRLIARAARPNGALHLSVGPERVPRGSFLGEAAGAENRLEIVLEGGSNVQLVGQGAGRWPTTTSVMGDVHEIVRRRSAATVQ